VGDKDGDNDDDDEDDDDDDDEDDDNIVDVVGTFSMTGDKGEGVSLGSGPSP